MSTWTTPITWTAASVVTAAQMNAEIRDHANFLKGSIDTLTNGTTADTGDSTYLRVARPTAGDSTYRGLVTADAFYRYEVHADGAVQWGSGAAALDTRLQRTGVGILKLDTVTSTAARLDLFSDSSSVALSVIQSGDTAGRGRFRLDGTGVIEWGDGTSVNDTNLYRAGASQLKTDDQFIAGDGITTRVVAGAVSDGSFTVTPGSGTIAIDTTNFKIYVRMGSTWKSTVALT
jgi:hypothetical protein